MNLILTLLKKDLLRDLKRPWSIITMISIPVILAALMANIFGGGSPESNINLHVAVWDQDDDFFGGMLRSMGSQGDAPQSLNIHYVESIDEGIALLEKRRVSAFLVLPENMTSDLLNGATTAIKLYPNPAEYVLPRVVEQGMDLVAVGVSQAVTLVGPEIRESIDLFEGDDYPPSWEVAMIVYNAMEKMRRLRSYLFPPIITMETVPADQYILSTSRSAAAESQKDGV